MLPKVISGLSILLRDDSALVKKRVVQGCTSIYRNTLQWVCSSEDVTDELERCWDNLCYIKVSITLSYAEMIFYGFYYCFRLKSLT